MLWAGTGMSQGGRKAMTRNGIIWNKCEAEAKHRVREPKSERAKVLGRKIIALALSWRQSAWLGCVGGCAPKAR